MKSTKSAVKIWRRQKVVREKLGWEGRIISFTKINVAGKRFSGQTPYYVVLAENNKGERMMAQLSEGYTPELGAKVKAVLRRVFRPKKGELVVYGVKFVLV